MIRNGVNVTGMKYLDNDLLLPEMHYGSRKVWLPSREDEYEDINSLLPTAEYIESLSTERHRNNEAE